MKYCKDCELYECSLRTPLGGCGDFVGHDPQFIHTMQKSLQDRINCDWNLKKFRREAAMMAMLGILAGRKMHQGIQETAEYAVKYADELIKQLKDD